MKQKTLSSSAKNYIDSLIRHNKIFTVSTITKHFPGEDATIIEQYVLNSHNTYTPFTNTTVFLPKAVFATNGATLKNATVKARSSKVSSKTSTHVELSTTLVDGFKLSCREYKYEIKNNIITIYSSSTRKLPSFKVWKNNRAVIPVSSVGDYSIVLK